MVLLIFHDKKQFMGKCEEERCEGRRKDNEKRDKEENVKDQMGYTLTESKIFWKLDAIVILWLNSSLVLCNTVSI